MFPVRPVPQNNVRKPSMFVFADMDDYKQRGQNVDREYLAWREEQKRKKTASPETKKSEGLVGQLVTHKTNGKGVIQAFDGKTITIRFENKETKTYNYEFCMERQLLEIG